MACNSIGTWRYTEQYRGTHGPRLAELRLGPQSCPVLRPDYTRSVSSQPVEGIMEGIPEHVQIRAIDRCWAELLDDIVLDICQQAHRRAKADGAWGGSMHGSAAADDCAVAGQAAPPLLRPPTPPAAAKGTSSSVDIFGQTHPAKAVDIVVCKNCGR